MGNEAEVDGFHNGRILSISLQRLHKADAPCCTLIELKAFKSSPRYETCFVLP